MQPHQNKYSLYPGNIAGQELVPGGIGSTEEVPSPPEWIRSRLYHKGDVNEEHGYHESHPEQEAERKKRPRIAKKNLPGTEFHRGKALSGTGQKEEQTGHNKEYHGP